MDYNQLTSLPELSGGLYHLSFSNNSIECITNYLPQFEELEYYPLCSDINSIDTTSPEDCESNIHLSEYAPSLQKKIPSIVSARKSYVLNLGDAKQIIKNELERSNVSGNSLKRMCQRSANYLEYLKPF